MSLEGAIDRLRLAESAWTEALDAHIYAEPNPGFADRLRAIADASEQQQQAFECAAQERLAWNPLPHHPGGRPAPYELSVDSGRVGPAQLWERFDRAFAASGFSWRAPASPRSPAGSANWPLSRESWPTRSTPNAPSRPAAPLQASRAAPPNPSTRPATEPPGPAGAGEPLAPASDPDAASAGEHIRRGAGGRVQAAGDMGSGPPGGATGSAARRVNSLLGRFDAFDELVVAAGQHVRDAQRRRVEVYLNPEPASQRPRRDRHRGHHPAGCRPARRTPETTGRPAPRGRTDGHVLQR